MGTIPESMFDHQTLIDEQADADVPTREVIA
jgi:hypothetical protein